MARLLACICASVSGQWDSSSAVPHCWGAVGSGTPSSLLLLQAPLAEGYRTVFGNSQFIHYLTLLLTVGLICSFHSFMYCAGQIISAIARDHYFPSWLGTQHPRGTPARALTAGSLISLGTLLVLHAFMGEERLGEIVIAMALIGVLISNMCIPSLVPPTTSPCAVCPHLVPPTPAFSVALGI